MSVLGYFCNYQGYYWWYKITEKNSCLQTYHSHDTSESVRDVMAHVTVVLTTAGLVDDTGFKPGTVIVITWSNMFGKLTEGCDAVYNNQVNHRVWYQGQGQVITSHGICGVQLPIPALDACFWLASLQVQHWNGKAVMQTTFTSLTALDVATTTTCSAANDYKLVHVTTCPFPLLYCPNNSSNNAGDLPMNIKKSLVQIMACRLTGAKPLSEPMLDYC